MGTTKATTETPSLEANREQLHQIVKGSRQVLLLSHGEDRKIVGRPMALVKLADDGVMYLVTGIDSKKVAEVLKDPRVTVAVQNMDGTAMIDGDAVVSQDRTLVAELWQDSWKVWFEDGKSDPTIAILIVTPNEATYWAAGISHGLSFLWRYVKARATGTEMEFKPGDQQKVDLRQ